jgi:hypothetical protein
VVSSAGRSAFGITHIRLKAFCSATVTPRAPYTLTTTPITRAGTLPVSDRMFSLIWSPTTGKLRSAEFSTAVCSSGSSCSAKPSTVSASSSSGNSDTKP